MRRLRTPPLALALLLSAGACEFLPPGPLAGLEAPAPLPRPMTSWLDLGRRLLAADRPEQAQAAFIRSLRLEGITAAALTGAGIAAERLGMLTEARRFFEQARLRAPDSVTVENNLGAVLYRLGEVHDARRAFQAALSLSHGTSDVAARNLGISEAAIRRAEGAADYKRNVRNPHRVERLGRSRFRLLAGSEL